MATKKEIEDQIAALQADLDSAEDDDVELWVEHPTTKAVGRLRGAHATSFLESILGKPEPAADPAADPGADPAGRKPAKKTAAGAPPAADPGTDPAPRSSVWGRK